MPKSKGDVKSGGRLPSSKTGQPKIPVQVAPWVRSEIEAAGGGVFTKGVEFAAEVFAELHSVGFGDVGEGVEFLIEIFDRLEQLGDGDARAGWERLSPAPPASAEPTQAIPGG